MACSWSALFDGHAHSKKLWIGKPGQMLSTKVYELASHLFADSGIASAVS